MRKKVLSVLLCTAMAATMLTGCGGSSDDTNKGTNNDATSGASSATSEKKSAAMAVKFLTSVFGTMSSRAVSRITIRDIRRLVSGKVRSAT